LIIVKIVSGLGNQLFQYALGRHIAMKNNTKLKLDVSIYEKDTYREFGYREFGLNNFNITCEYANDHDLLAVSLPNDNVYNKLKKKFIFT
jgi:hypothetical protein